MKVLIFLIFFGELSVFSSPILETIDRVEINWTSLKIRFFGEAGLPVTGAPEAAYPDMEKLAWNDGLLYIYDNLAKIREQKKCWAAGQQQEESAAQASREASREVSTSTYSYSTTYFASGEIRIHMESSLVKALHPGAHVFAQETNASLPESSLYTGVVFRVDGQLRPCPVFALHDSQTGSLLFDVSQMEKGSFGRGFMARWAKNPSPGEVKKWIGDRPLTIPVEANDTGLLSVDQEVWSAKLAQNTGLLSQGKVLMALQ